MGRKLERIQVSYTKASTFQECQRKFWFRYILKRYPISSPDAIRWGKIWHQVMESFWQIDSALSADLRRVAAITTAQNLTSLGDGTPIHETEVAKIIAMLTAYRPPVDLYETVSVEDERIIKLPAKLSGVRGVDLLVKADSILRRKSDGSLVVREAKTTTREISGHNDYWRGLFHRNQGLLYMLAYDIDTVMYDVVRRPLLKPSAADWSRAGLKNDGADVLPAEVLGAYMDRMIERIGSEPDEWHQIRVVQYTERQRDEALSELADVACQIRRAKGSIYPRSTGACMAFSRACPYLPVCERSASIWDDNLFEGGRNPVSFENVQDDL